MSGSNEWVKEVAELDKLEVHQLCENSAWTLGGIFRNHKRPKNPKP